MYFFVIYRLALFQGSK